MDPAQVDQIVANLCVNARDAIKEHGKIVIKTKNLKIEKPDQRNSLKPGEYVLVSVTDDGCGMSDEIKKRIFDPFFTTKTLGRGTGLGLATVQDIVQRNKGVIKLDSEENKGSTFTIFIPRFVGNKFKQDSESLFKNSVMGKGETILLVEDDQAILKLTGKIMEGLNYKVFATDSPGEAIKIASNLDEKIDLLLTDVIMPEMNGKQLYQQISSVRKSIRVIFMSGYSFDIISEQGCLDSQTNLVQKPFTIKDLSEMIHKVLSA